MKIFKTPFAATGDRIAIPVVEQPSGEVSQPTGWTPDYQLPNTDPNYKPVGRDEMNGILFEITEALGQLQQFGFADWQNITGGWPEGANVNHGGGVWQSLANSNTEEPGTGVLWKPILFDNVGQSTESVLGLLKIATTAQAQALTADDVALTPKKLGDVTATETRRGILEIATTAEAQAMTDDQRALTPKKLADAFSGANRSVTGDNRYQIFPGTGGTRRVVMNIKTILSVGSTLAPGQAATVNFDFPIAVKAGTYPGIVATARNANLMIGLTGSTRWPGGDTIIARNITQNNIGPGAISDIHIVVVGDI